MQGVVRGNHARGQNIGAVFRQKQSQGVHLAHATAPSLPVAVPPDNA